MPDKANWPKVDVIRLSTSQGGTTSKVKINNYSKGEGEFYGLELPWRDNKPFVSCIPSGEYVLIPWESEKYGSCYAFVGGEVSLYEGNGNRFACLIHAANYARQLQGCLALGRSDGVDEDGNPAVWNSRDALSGFMELAEGKPCNVSIRWME